MDDHELRRRFAALTTAHLADACIRAQLPVRCAPARVHAVVPGSRLAGRVCPARHAGSVDIFLSLRTQVQFDSYLAQRQRTPSLSFRDHLRAVGGAIEE